VSDTRLRRSWPLVAIVLATLFWAGNYVVGAIAVRSMSPFELTFLRWALAVAPLVVIAQLVEKPDWKAVLRRWPLQLGLALTGMLGYTLFLYAALQHTTAVNASLINALNPAMIAVLAALLVRDKLTGRGLAGIAVGLVGVMVVIVDGDLAGLLTRSYNTGDLLMLAAILVWSLYTIYGRGLSGVPPIASTAAQAGIAVVVMLPFAPAMHLSWPAEPSAVASLLYIAAFPSVGSYLLWNAALRKVRPGRAGVYLNLITVFTVLISAVLGTRLGLPQLLGGLLVFAGVLLVAQRRRPLPAGTDGRAPLKPSAANRKL
jgi:drug/metabolite transporter (DMT)-like permease